MAPQLRSGKAGTPPNGATAPQPSSRKRAGSSIITAGIARLRVDKGRKRSGLEIPRKVLHSSMCIAAVAVYLYHPSVPVLVRGFSVALAIIISADLLRFKYPAFEKFYEGVLGYFMREEERDHVNGVIYYLVGVLVCMVLYPRDIATLSIIVLSLCDTSASVFGRLFGKYTPKLPFSGSLFGAKKSMAGTLAAVATGCLASYVFWTRFAALGDEHDVSWIPARLASTWTGKASTDPSFIPRLPNPQSTLPLWALVLVNGVVAGVSEAIDVFGCDDNLSLPILFGLFAQLSMWLLK